MSWALRQVVFFSFDTDSFVYGSMAYQIIFLVVLVQH